MDGIGATTAVSSRLYGRTLARAQALQLLFQAEACGRTVSDVLSDDYALSDGPLDEYGEQLARGAYQELAESDRLISRASDRWELSRMPAVDRNLLRVCVFEILHVHEVPTAVTIDESVELAKAFGTDDSAKFINGVLGRIAREAHNDAQAEPEAEKDPEASEAPVAAASPDPESSDTPADEAPSRATSLADLAALDAEAE